MGRPICRYHGGKWILAPWIISHFPHHEHYTETFGGAGSVLLRKKRAKCSEVYNDLFGDVVNLFTVVRDNGKELQRMLELTPFAREEFDQSYLPTDNPLERARRTLVRSYMGHGSASTSLEVTGFRSSSRQSGSAPANDWVNFPASLDNTIERLKGVVIENRPAIQVMRRIDSCSTLHYVDPPYMHHRLHYTFSTC